MADDGQLEKLLADSQAGQSNRYYGKYRGSVTQLGKDADGVPFCLKAKVHAVFGDERESGWAKPCVPFAGPGHGFIFLPEVGDTVWIEFEAGRLDAPIWTGFAWRADQTPPKPGSEKVRLIATSKGHQIALDEDADTIEITHPGGAKITIKAAEIALTLGACSLKISTSEINLNNGMVKVTAAGASLVNDALKIGG